jgi:hypothetical protein
MAELSYAQVSALLKYDSETGKLYWLERPVELFKGDNIGNAVAARRWNKMYAGQEAFICLSNSGYRKGNIFGRPYLAHRIAWLLCMGDWPSGVIDHIDGNKLNNTLRNLRDASYSENGCNGKMRSDNTSGVTGVYWNKKARKWQAQMSLHGRWKSLGAFDSLDDAAAARREANIKYGFTERHGTMIAL